MISDATDFLIVHELLRKAGLPESKVEAWLPYLPRALRDRWSVAPDFAAVRQKFANDVVRAYEAGMPAESCLAGLESGIMPLDSLLVWQAGRSHDTYWMVSKASMTMRMHANNAHLSTQVAADLVEASHADLREWLASPIPRERVLLYIRAGVSPTEALTLWEPQFATDGDLSRVETLAALRPSLTYDQTDPQPDPVQRR